MNKAIADILHATMTPEFTERVFTDLTPHIHEYREKFPILYHGTTSFRKSASPVSLKRIFDQTSLGDTSAIHASHHLSVAATYAAVIKDHPHMDILGPVPMLVIDDKEPYLEKLKQKDLIVCKMPNGSFTPMFDLDYNVVEWIAANDDIHIPEEDIIVFKGLDDVLRQGVQIFFTHNGVTHEDIRGSYFKAPLDTTIKTMIKTGRLEWANLERGISPAPVMMPS